MGQNSSSNNHSNSRAGSGRSQDRLTGVALTPPGIVSNSNSPTSTSYNANEPLKFHGLHGSNVVLSPDGKSARRSGSFCNAIVFTNRPVKCMEKVSIKFTDTTGNWSGVIRFGFTSRSPVELGTAPSLPRYACPDLTSRPGFWAKALGESYADKNNVLSFWVNRQGEVMYSVNNDNKGVFFNDVETNEPLWGLMDIYGNTVEVRLTECAETEPTRAPILDPPSDFPVPLPQILPSPVVDLDTDSSQSSFGSLLHSNDSLASGEGLVSRIIPGILPVPFHEICGLNVLLNPSKIQARRIDGEFQNGLVFLSQPVHAGELVVIEVLETTPRYLGCLAVGVTSCDPAVLTPSMLPEDSEDLYDRQEYWALSRDIALPDSGDQLSFIINPDGEVHYHENGIHRRVLMHVDISQPLWMLFDVYGSTQKIKILGIVPVNSATTPTTSIRTNSAVLENSLNIPTFLDLNISPLLPRRIGNIPDSAGQDLHDSVSGLVGTGASSGTAVGNSGVPKSGEECVICYDRPVDSVIYTCGHMCLCHPCGVKLKQQAGAVCPICRSILRDVIKTYKA
ncbi:protein neuralized-like [Saccoglossus kowalevskii]|uniref:RING-type E3 ubiquitin transferase n=1 Tax=Saccoglossus kowalevskii TaxID=10224 RepID=A0A0U2UNF3_SACKO|nr:PREDICTED: protein neuralized-like [Saccoglossus kowalevskii]ALR88701.1 neuralized-like 226 [Saccoglossus kowalevskii]